MNAERSVKGYQLYEELGAGGFGVVYRAYQPIVEREVVIKVILPRYTNQPEFIRRFEAEAQLIARLEHPHIVPLFDYWRDPQGAYLVMRLLRGGSLLQYLKLNEPTSSDILRWIEQITAALSIAHRHNIVHRDIKPANILLDEEHNAYLTDFGIAKKIDSQDDAEGPEGSIGYIAPEQLEGGAPLVQSDIYSLGILLYELLTNEHPYGSDLSFSQMALKHFFEPIPDVVQARPDLPPSLNAILQRATAKTPAARYLDVRELALDLRQALRSEDQTKRTALEMPALVPTNPYKGLRAFEEADAGDFFGRDALIEQLLDHLRNDCFMVVIGPSGSGKSSVIHAGLVPALRQGKLPLSQEWFIVAMIPGTHPLENLTAALHSVAIDPPPNLLERLQSDPRALLHAANTILPDLPHTEDDPPLLLIIDQFEEVFTLVEEETERAHFLTLLQLAVTGENSRLRLICNLRADFYDRPLLYEGFGALMRERTQVVLPLNTEEIHRTILGPAERVGLQVDSELVAQITSDLHNEPGILPLLQYALTELFERREGNRLNLQAYLSSGGVLGALARRAQEVYDSLPLSQQYLTRQIFLRLVALGDGTEDTRRRVLLSELVAIAPHKAQLDQVLEAFGKYRLLTFDLQQNTREPTVEVAHEAIIGEWALLQTWLDESRQDIRLQRLLAQATDEWSESRQDDSYLLRDARLSQYEEWVKTTSIAISPRELAFVEASIVARETLAEAEKERQKNEILLLHRTRTRTRLLMVALLVALGGIILTSYALFQRREALDARAISQMEAANAQTQAAIAATAQYESAVLAETAIAAQFQASTSEAYASSAALAGFAQQVFLVNNNRELGLALALAAYEFENAPSIVNDVLGQIGLSPGTRRLFADERYSSGLWLADFSPDGTHVITGSYNGVAILWEVATGQVRHTFRHTNNTVGAADISPDGRWLITGSYDTNVRLWDLTTGEAIGSFLGNHKAAVESVAFNSDGSQFVSASDKGDTDNPTVIVWDSTTTRTLLEISTQESIYRAIFSPDDRYILTGSAIGEVALWDAQTGAKIRDFVGHTEVGQVWYLAFHPSGKTFFSGVFTTNEERRFIEWDTETGALLRIFEDPATSSSLNAFALSPDGNYAAVALIDGAFQLWDLRQQRIINTFKGHTDTIYGLVFSPDGQQIFSASIDGTGRLWDLNNGAQVNRLDLARVNHSLAAHPTNPDLLLVGADNEVMLWNLAENKAVWTQPEMGVVRSVAFSPDGTRLVAASSANYIALLDAINGRIIARWVDPDTEGNAVNRVAFSPDGGRVIAGYEQEDSNVLVWEVATGEKIATLVGHVSPINATVISPDGRTAASGADAGNQDENTLIIWDMTTYEPIFILNPGSLEALAYSPDGTQLAVGFSGGGLQVWEVATGELLQTLQGHSSSVEAVAFSADGQVLLSGSADRTLILWNLATSEPLLRFYGHTNPVTSAIFSIDGHTIFSSAFDGTIRQWQILDIEQIVAWIAENRYVHPLTANECSFYRVLNC